ncbi:MAG: sulfite reductase subunit alpha [Pseudomonadota bacterium]
MTPDPATTKLPDIALDAPISDEQRIWLAGYLAGMKAQMGTLAQVAPTQSAGATLDIVFGSQTGNAEQLAESAAELASQSGFSPALRCLDDLDMAALASVRRCLVVVSTYGEGEMPDNAELFWESLSATTAPRLEQMHYAVLALGDTSYDDFCEAGKLIDTRFEQLGATRVAARIDCDVDFEDPANDWLEAVLPKVRDTVADDELADTASETPTPTERKKPTWTRKNPYTAQTLENHLLSGADSAKEIRHFSFSLGDSGIEYDAGDALCVMPRNCPALVELLLQRVNATGEEVVAGYDQPLAQVLQQQLEIVTPPKTLLQWLHDLGADDELSRVVSNGDKEALETFLWGRDTLDLLNLNPALSISATDLVACLRPLQHRAYSISSSPLAFPNEIHLTVAAVRWRNTGREHRGVASTWLADHLQNGDSGRIFLSPNKSFRLPADGDRPVIMVGPGTGIAPFRAFLQARHASGAAGKNWLFFGDQHRECDFIYEDEIGEFCSNGTLTRLDLAFSRDQQEKIYVQQRMRENGKALYAWLEEGAHFYVCGDATRMARDVDQALLDVVRTHGRLTEEDAVAYINQLRRDKRYLRDVY